MDIVVWLRSLGLGRYEAAFRENDMDETVSDLTADDLKDLGVSIVGHRRKLLDAIAALRTDTIAPSLWYYLCIRILPQPRARSTGAAARSKQKSLELS
jgi:SAM domain (Sterile alpha motif)